MRNRHVLRLCLALLLAFGLSTLSGNTQAQTRIFGTNSSGQAVPIQVASDGSLKIMLLTSGFEFEGTTADAFETTLAAVDPTEDRAINLPDAAGTVALVENTLGDFAATTSAQLAGVLSNETGTGVVVLGTSPVFTTDISVGAAGVKLSDDGDGALTIAGLGNGSDENLILNLDDTADTGTFTSGTGLATLNFSSIALQESGVGVLNADEIDASTELAAIMDDETGTGALVFGTAPVFTTSATAGLIATQDIIKLLPVTDDDRFTATLTVADLSEDRTITLPNLAGTVALVGVANAGTVSATGFLVGTTAGVDKTCTAADAVITVVKGLVTAVTCTTAEPAPDAGAR